MVADLVEDSWVVGCTVQSMADRIQAGIVDRRRNSARLVCHWGRWAMMAMDLDMMVLAVED